MSPNRLLALRIAITFASEFLAMKKLSPEVHGVLDYVTVLCLFISPALLHMPPISSAFTYVLATIHLVLTLFTDYRPGLLKLIPLRIHGLIEIIVSIGLVGVAVWFRILGEIIGFYFYLAFSLILFIVWMVSEYRIIKVHS